MAQQQTPHSTPPAASTPTTPSTLSTKLSILAPSSHVLSLHTPISMLTPKSLSAFPTLSWSQTPWLARPLPSSLHASYPHSHTLLFGTTTPSGPKLYIRFPHATSPVCTDLRKLEVWHNAIVKPAFDRCWRDCCLTPMHGAEIDGGSRIRPGRGVWSDRDALPFAGFKTRLANYTKLSIPGAHIAAAWPENSPKQMGEAWDAIMGMLNGHPDMREWQDPELVAVWVEDVAWNEELGMMKVYERVAREWEKVVDADFVKDGSLEVVVETCLGVGGDKGIKRKADDMGDGNEKIEKVEKKIDRGKGKAMDLDEEAVEGVECETEKEGIEEKMCEGAQGEEEHRGKRRKAVLEE